MIRFCVSRQLHGIYNRDSFGFDVGFGVEAAGAVTTAVTIPQLMILVCPGYLSL
jgi:hypothetical protein